MKILHEAKLELIEAAEYYESCQSGLGAKFLDVVNDAYRDIKGYPDAYTSVGKHLRKFAIRPYPYAIIYAFSDDEITIVSIMHQKRRPGYWRNRLTDES